MSYALPDLCVDAFYVKLHSIHLPLLQNYLSVRGSLFVVFYCACGFVETPSPTHPKGTDHTLVCMRVAKRVSLKAPGHEGVDVINFAEERNQWQVPLYHFVP
jgi:hypothetical protein